MLFEFFSSLFKAEAPTPLGPFVPKRTYTFRQLLDAIGEASKETGVPPPHLSDDLEWVLDSIAAKGIITFHSMWPEHKLAREYCRELSKMAIAVYEIHGSCTSVTLCFDNIDALLDKKR